MALEALISSSDFETHPLYIVESEFVEKLDNNLILDVQEYVARKLLGDVLYYDFDADYDSDSDSFNSQKWTDFVEGYTFTVLSKNVKWLGFKNMLKYFVYFENQKYNRIQYTTLGNLDSKLENGIISNDFTNEIKQYNKGVDLYGWDWSNLFLKNTRDIHYDFLSNRKVNIEDRIERIKPTAYNFLYNRMTEFENWEFTQIGKVNNFGI